MRALRSVRRRLRPTQLLQCWAYSTARASRDSLFNEKLWPPPCHSQKTESQTDLLSLLHLKKKLRTPQNNET